MTLTVLRPAANLPVPLTGFVGREGETAAVRQQLGEARLVTLTGAGGSGKTRLALSVAHGVQAAGTREVAWIELAALETGDALAAHVAMALGARTEGGGSIEQALSAVVRDRVLLLVLDNCEHLVEAAATLVEQLLHVAPQLRVLTTSREALGVAGERSWLVPALTLPASGDALTPASAMTAAAVRLFVERAQDVLPSFTLTEANLTAVVQICRRLDGLPLALELAAARVAVLTPAQLAARLDDRFALLTTGARSALPRHRTLRAAVDWSYDLLNPLEQILLERLAIFAGGCSLDAAEAVCAGDGIADTAVLDLLAALTTRSLVTMQEEEGVARYILLETIREYAAEKRSERGASDALAERHAAHYLAVVRGVEPDLVLGRAQRLRQMDIEHENLRVALAWSARAERGSEFGLPISWALLWYWFHRQLWSEGFSHFETALATAKDPAQPLRAAALHGLGLFGLYAGNTRSRDRLEEADRLWEECALPHWRAFTLLVRTVESNLRRDATAATGFAHQAVAVARTTNDPWVVALTQAHALVPCLLWAEQWQEADALLAEAERVYRDHAYTIGVAYVLDARAFTALQVGDPDRAVRLAQASLREEPTGQNRWLAGRSLRTLGAVLMARGMPDRAVTLYAAAEAMYEAIGARALTEERLAVNQLPDQLQQQLGAAVFAAAWAQGRALPFREAVAAALAVDSGDEVVQRDTAPPPAVPVATTAPLDVRALGQLEVLRDGVVVPAEAWPYAKPRELLLYLLVHPEGRSREQVGLAFWPEISTAQVKNNFHVTLHHLRKALGGSEWIRFDRGRYRVAFEAGVEFDVAHFESTVVSALRTLRTRPDDLSAATALASVLPQYRGPFLDDESVGDWHLELRDRLARLHEEALFAVGACFDRAGRHADAVEIYQRLTAIDPLHESAAHRLMLALARDNRRSEALRAFDRLALELQRELDTGPSAAVVALADRLRAGEAV